MESDDPSKVFLESTRFWIQRVFVPILVFVGIGGNLITVMVLTRRRMRCSTNIYLTALAIADTVYLFFVLLLSFKHYPNISEQKYELYWRFNGIIHWFCDAASNTSVWLTVSFTVERYIAVCHPMKGKRICTESRAKNIIAVVTIVCILAVASTAFERQLSVNIDCVEYCDKPPETSNSSAGDGPIGNASFCGVFVYVPYIKNASTIDSYHLDIRSPLNLSAKADFPLAYVPCGFLRNIDHRDVASNRKSLNKNHDSADNEELSPALNGSDVEGGNSTGNGTFCCKKHFRMGTEETALGKSDTYVNVFSWFTAITFTLIPLALIAVFNTFLVKALYKSQRRRKTLATSQESVNQSNENRITLVLIGVVIMFLICQLPTACYLIYCTFSSVSDPHTQNILRALGNIFNMLITVNASCNFLLYCVLSAKYRSTFKSLFCERRLKRQDTLALSLTRSTNSKRFNPNSAAFKRNASYTQTPRNLETQSLTEAPRSKSLIVRQNPGAKSRSCDFNV